MIIYGSRMYFKKRLVNSFGECEHCGRYGKMRSYQARKFGHIYFIPLIPMGAHSQVLRECRSCDMGVHIGTEQLGGLVESLSDQFKSWVVALSEGLKEVEPAPGEEPVNIGALISGSLDDFYCLGEIESVDSIIELMDASGLQMEKEMVLGRWAEIHGDLEAAISHNQAAHRIDPTSGYPLFQLGHLNLLKGDLAAAETAYEQYSRLFPDDLSPVVELAGAYEVKKDWPKIVQYYDAIYEASPEVVADRAMKKVYKKACKKSGLQGKFLNQM